MYVSIFLKLVSSLPDLINRAEGVEEHGAMSILSFLSMRPLYSVEPSQLAKHGSMADKSERNGES